MRNPFTSRQAIVPALLCLCCLRSGQLRAEEDVSSFGEPTNLGVLADVNRNGGFGIMRGSMTEDGLTLYFDVFDVVDPPNSRGHIARATRASTLRVVSRDAPMMQVPTKMRATVARVVTLMNARHSSEPRGLW